MRLVARHLRWLAFTLFCACAWPCQAAAAGPRQVVLLLSDSSALYRETAQAIRAELESEPGKLAVRSVVVGEVGADSLASPDALIVTIGLKAVQFAAKLEAPTLAVLVARQSYESLATANPVARRRSLSAIYLDQPPARHLNLIRTSLPDVRSVGVLVGPAQAAAQTAAQTATQTEWAGAARALGLGFVPIPVPGGNDLFPALQAALPEVDALLLLPDPAVVNRGTIQNLMLTAYRQRVPVIGYSQALVEAGSLLAVYSTPQQIGQQAGETIARMLSGRGWELPAASYPRYFTVKSNASVGRALELAIPSDAVLLRRLGGNGS